MSAKLNLVGFRPLGSRLLIVAEVESRNGKRMWKCLCDCGNKAVLQGPSLMLIGGTKSCGCLRRQAMANVGKSHHLPLGQSVKNNAYLIARMKAKRRGWEFGLTKDQFFTISEASCHYCGRSPRRSFKGAKGLLRKDYVCNGIDRIDSSKGYVIGNCRTSCRPCNVAKSDLAENEFYEMISAIYHNRLLKAAS